MTLKRQVSNVSSIDEVADPTTEATQSNEHSFRHLILSLSEMENRRMVRGVLMKRSTIFHYGVVTDALSTDKLTEITLQYNVPTIEMLCGRVQMLLNARNAKKQCPKSGR